MAKGISMGMWTSIISDKLYNKWVGYRWIRDGEISFYGCDKGELPGKKYVMKKKELHKTIKSQSVKKRLSCQGFECIDEHYAVATDKYEKMRKDIDKFYDKVFNYVIKNLKRLGFINLKSGNFKTGFCAETDPKREVVKDWGAPLAGKENKIIQIKEKFGRITVYFKHPLSDEDEKLKDKLSTQVEKKFDCITSFG